MTTDDSTEQTQSQMLRRHLAWIGLCVVLILAAAVRVRLLDVPLERDEGEYAYAGQLILQGVPPYKLLYNMKLPGIYAAYALILAVFGQTHRGIHLGLLMVNSATIVIVFLLGKRLFGGLGGLASALAFAILSIGPAVQGFSANAEHFVILPAVGGILLLLRALDARKLGFVFASGLLLGISFIVKQHGLFFVAFGGAYLLYHKLRASPRDYKQMGVSLLVLFAGAAVPFAVTCLILYLAGVFDKFWLWTVVYARQYVLQIPLASAPRIFIMRTTTLVESAYLLWLLAAAGLVSVCWRKKSRVHAPFAVGYVLFSFAAVCPGLYFRPHYFVLLLPAAGLLVGSSAVAIRELFAMSRLWSAKTALSILVVLLAGVNGLWKQRTYLVDASPERISRMAYGPNPFIESLEIAKFVRENSGPDETVAVIGSEPQIYFYSKRRSATGHIYTYALMEEQTFAHEMQEEMISEIEESKPGFLLFVNIPTSWLARKNSETLIFEWFNEYSPRHYALVGIVDILGSRKTVYRWGQECVGYQPQSNSYITILRRKSSGLGEPSNAVLPPEG